jgi:hypothetical protein
LLWQKRVLRQAEEENRSADGRFSCNELAAVRESADFGRGLKYVFLPKDAKAAYRKLRDERDPRLKTKA